MSILSAGKPSSRGPRLVREAWGAACSLLTCDLRTFLPKQPIRLRWSVKHMMALVAIVALGFGYTNARAHRREERRRAAQQQYEAAWFRSRARTSAELAVYTQREIDTLREGLDRLPQAKADAARRSIIERERVVNEYQAEAASLRKEARRLDKQARKTLGR